MDEDELARLYTSYGYVVFRRCFHYLRDESAAHDAVQEVFLRALKSRTQFRGDADPRTWLCRIADNLCRDLVRRNRCNPVRLARRDASEGEGALERPVSLSEEAGDARLIASGMLNELDESSQRLAVLYYVDELTQDEIAAELGLSRKTIGKRLNSILKRARAFLAPTEAS